MQIETGASNTGKLTVQSLAAMYRGKKELYNLLTVDCGYFCPPFKHTNVYQIRDIISAKKKAIKTQQVKYLFAPQYPSLSIEKILEFALQFPEIKDYLPDERDWPMLQRQWLLNVCFTVIGSQFADFVRERIEQRNESLADRNDLNVEIDSEILDVIRNSSAISTVKGSSAALMVGTKRRRSKAQLLELRQFQESQMTSMAERDQRIRELEGQINASKQKLQTGEQAESLVSQMLDAGALLLQEDGTYTVKQD